MKKVMQHYILLAILLYTIAGMTTIFLISKWITENHFEIMGENTINLATLASNALSMTDEQLREMENMTFEELLLHEKNRELSRFFKKTGMNQDVKYAYVVRKLEGQAIKYHVSSSDAEFYEMPVGTPLDWIWLMDVIVNREEQTKVDLDKDYYIDKNRYTHVGKETDILYENRKSGYFFNNDEWGSQISGMVPIYTVEGNYIGLLGVDVYSTGFFTYRDKVMKVLSLLFFIPTAILTVIYFGFHLRYRKEMKEIVFIDKMTGLYTRAFYEDYARKLAKKLRRAEDSLTVVMMDIDEFKAYNDLYGHTKGDECIKLIGEAIRIEAEAVGGCPGRFGGEEFVIFVPNIGMEQGDKLCENIRKRVEGLDIQHEMREGIKKITISLGIYTSKGEDMPIEPLKLVEKADRALYMAKGAGRNCFIRAE